MFSGESDEDTSEIVKAESIMCVRGESDGGGGSGELGKRAMDTERLEHQVEIVECDCTTRCVGEDVEGGLGGGTRWKQPRWPLKGCG